MTRRADRPVYAVAVVLALGYLLLAPHTGDLAAQTARADLFRRSGMVPYWTGWFAGLPTVSYSLITPFLLGWLHPVGLGSLSIVATTAVAIPLLRNANRPIAGSIAVAVSATLDVISGRTTFAVGLVFALAAVLAVERRRPVVAGLLAIVATAASPVAGVALLVVVAALLIADPARRVEAAAAVLGVALVLGLLAWLSRGDGGGFQPYSTPSMLWSVGTVLVVAVAPVGRRVRTGAVLAVVVLVGAYTVHSPVGSNVTRIAILGAAPVFVAAASARRSRFALGLALTAVLPVAQLQGDLAHSRAQDHTRSFVTPLLAELARTPDLPNHRVELVDTVTHWPTTYLLPTVDLARGWERQTDEARNPMFYGRAPLTAPTYRTFLDANAVGLVAVPVGVPIDFGSTREDHLIGSGLPYLHRIWDDAHWTLYAVERATPIVAAPARITASGDTGFTVDVPAAGSYPIRLRWSPYLVVTGGSVLRGPADQTTLRLDGPGAHRLHAVWRLP